MWYLGTWFSGGLTVGVDDLKGFLPPKQFCDSTNKNSSVILQAKIKTVTRQMPADRVKMQR